MGVIGDTLSEARIRRAVDLEEVHAATGIRARYLRAIEEEDWEALPEDFYARSFVRKYAQFLGVDPEPLVEEYRRQRGTGGRGDAPTSPFARTNSRRAEALRRRRRRQGIYVWLGVGALAVAVIVAIVLLASQGEEGGSGMPQNTAKQGAGQGAKGKAKGTGAGKGKKGAGGAQAKNGAGAAKSQTVALAIEPTAEVWACVLDAKGKALVDGQILAPGEAVGPFHSRSYKAAFGNGSIEVTVDGKRAATPSTPSPMGFTVDSHGQVHELPEGERPSCE